MREWTRDVPGGELHRLIAFDGSFNGAVSREFGWEVLGEALAFVRSAIEEEDS